MSAKRSQTKQAPLHVVRSRDVVAEIHRRFTVSGFAYLDYSVARTYKARNSGREIRGANFFQSNQDDLIAVVREATAWIQAQHGAIDPELEIPKQARQE